MGRLVPFVVVLRPDRFSFDEEFFFQKNKVFSFYFMRVFFFEVADVLKALSK